MGFGTGLSNSKQSAEKAAFNSLNKAMRGSENAMHQILETVRKTKIIAIVRGLPREHMLGLAQALCDGGIACIEVTFNQAKPESWQDTAEAIRSVGARFAGSMAVGAGTVIRREQLHLAIEAGAGFIVSPNTDADILREAKNKGLAVFPGALTPTEIALAHGAGADAVKLFPAGQFGPDYVRAVRAPLSHVPLLAVGGVSESNAGAFIAAGCIGVGVGGNLVNREWIERGQWDRVVELAREYRKAVR
jgi:2-dehydro-3-deoxyphosphogluconate aldolase/(4S)-4-hydroxy-2-oxoglutarate aldolase